MIRQRFHIVLAAFFLLSVLLSCGGRPEDQASGEAGAMYTADGIREVASTDYDSAMHLIEEALLKGQLPVFDANVLRARLTYQYTDNYLEAAEWMQKALDSDDVPEPSVRVELLYHLATIQKAARDYTSCLVTCAEGKELAHAIGHVYEENSFDFLAGSSLFAIGEDDKGLTMMRDAIDGASAVAGSVDEYGHLLYFVNNLVGSYIEIKDYAAALDECNVNEELLVRMETLQGVYADYLDRNHFYLDMNRAICYTGTGKSEHAARCFESAKRCSYASSGGGRLWMADFLAATGDPQGVLDIYSEVPYTDQDTVSRSYRYRLSRLGEAYANAGNAEQAAAMKERYDVISTLLEEKENAEGVKVKAAQYEAQQYRLTLSDAVSDIRHYRKNIVFLLVLIVVSFGLFILLNHWLSNRKEERHRKESEALEKDLRSLRKQVSIIAERELFANDEKEAGQKEAPSLAWMIEGKKLYLNKNLNRDSAAALLGQSQAEISRMLDEIEPGLSFPDYIKGLRIRHALQLLGSNPDIPIAELADRCGFYTTRTLQRSFLAITGKTPSEYAKELRKQAGGKS